jgi:hypothetical protein
LCRLPSIPIADPRPSILWYIAVPMNEGVRHRPLSRQDLEAILDVTKGLAAPFDLTTMLGAVVAGPTLGRPAAGGGVWL